MTEFVAFDLETTGLSPKTDRIIEVGAVRFDAAGSVRDRLEILVDPEMPVPLAVQRLTGIDERELRGQATPGEAVAQLADFASGARLVGHGAQFDVAHVVAFAPEVFRGRDVVDTLELARILLPERTTHSLPLLSAALGIDHDRPHRALSDAEATAALLVELLRRAAALPSAVLEGVRQLLGDRPGPLAWVFTTAVAGEGTPSPLRWDPARWALLRVPLESSAAAAPPEPAPAPATAEPAAPLEEAAAELLGPGGPFAARPGYEPRPEQLEMARAVAQTLDRGRVLLAEAGTGVGKSFAYLVPLALRVSRGGGPGVVATHTITLQEQLAERDLPEVLERTGLRLRAAMLKGRGHYVSLRRARRFLADPGPPGDTADERLRFKLKLLCWLAVTRTGDRSELRLTTQEEPFWDEVRSLSSDCLGGECANWRDASCHMVGARRGAANADIVVTNHALLLADAAIGDGGAGTLLPEHAALVVDEAHHLDAAATRQLGVELRARDIVALLDRSVLGRDDLQPRLERARDAVSRLFGDVKGFIGEQVGSDQPGNTSLTFGDDLRGSPRAQPLLRAARSADHALRDLAAAATAGPTGDSEVDAAAAALVEAAAGIGRVLLDPDPGHVQWVALRAEQGELHDAPLEVDGTVRAMLDRAGAAVLTSATLAVAGRFDHLRARLGLHAGVDELVLRSPFDWLRQALAVIPRGMPPWDAPEHDQAVADLVAATAVRLGGRMLVLFTGYSQLRRVHGLLRPRMERAGVAVLGQGIDGTRRQVLASLLGNGRTVVLGTSAFWEGIDVPGDALRCVVIDKLPFPVPTEPLVQARSAGLADPFRELLLPAAVLRLKQGVGRLIRHGDDRGAVVLCDPRLDSRRYGAAFIAAMPRLPFAREPLETVPAVVQAFVQRGELPPGTTVAEDLVAAEPWSDEPA